MTLKTFLLILIFQTSSLLFASTKIRIPVGAYPFAPYYELQDGEAKGITVDTLEILNKLQNDYEFRITEINPSRRYKLFEDLQIEMIFFEDPAWQWNKVEHTSIPLGIDDEEVYFALASKSAQPGYFDNFKTKRMVGLQGYHYRFADMSSDEDYLRKNYQMQFVNSYDASVLFVISDRADIGLATRSYLKTYFQQHPDHKARIRIGTKPDHSFSLKVVMSKKSKVSKARMQSLIDQLLKHPDFQKILAKHGLK
jgi:hypothetical protein